MSRDEVIAREIREVPFVEVLGERYVTYALSTIMSRSLPDVRDGLKPVHRRLLHAMRVLRLDPGSGFKKCARVVGDVIGKYHPHGDKAVYDTMVRLAQDFAIRYPLVDGQGNFGNVDGDGAAAMRYTEARLTAVAEAMLEGLDEDAVDFKETYDGEDEEPVVLPAAFPNLLANGAQGIAVGMACSIPPHNADELCGALLHLLRTPGARVENLLGYVTGPDFPTGGIVLETPEAIAEAYRTGRGRFRLRASWTEEKVGRGKIQIVVSEIPWGIPKARIVSQVDGILQKKSFPWLAGVRDESADDIRLVLELKDKAGDPGPFMEALFQASDLETRVQLNMNVLDAGRAPRVMGLNEVLLAWLDHRREVLVRRSQHRLAALDKRIHILEGHLIAHENLDEVIATIREADNPKVELSKKFSMSETQAEAVLDMRLRALKRLEGERLATELKNLSKERTTLRKLVRSNSEQTKCLDAEIRDVRSRFGGKKGDGARRTRIEHGAPTEASSLAEVAPEEPLTFICSERGWIRAVRGQPEAKSFRYREGDSERFVIMASSSDRILLATTEGRFYTLTLASLPQGRGFGEPVRMFAGIGRDEGIVSALVAKENALMLLASDDGRGFLAKMKDTLGSRRAGRQVMTLGAGQKLVVCRLVKGEYVACMGTGRKLLVFSRAEIPERGQGRGVILQRHTKGGFADAKTFDGTEGLACKTGPRTRTYTLAELRSWIGKRGQAGRIAPKGFPVSNRFD